ncbi:MAG: hypothetical protein FJW40_02015 [Acidobacteria bacterium]|nr:hypothetical protein [Acidobacteriota bacterium]
MTRRRLLQAAVAAPASGGPLDKDGMALVDGRRTFILGLYQLPVTGQPLREAAEAGVDVVHLPPERARFDEARAAGLRGWTTTGAKDLARVARVVESLRGHPGLMFWEVEDEPSFVWKKPREVRVTPEAMQAAYQRIRGLDTKHPVYLNHSPTNLVETLRRYNQSADIIATDIYPVIAPAARPQYALWPDGLQGDLLDTSVSQVGRYAEKMRQVAGPARGLFMVLQGFAWEMLLERDRNPAAVRYPTAAETRFMALQAIAHGVTGLLWWGLHKTPAEAPVWAGLRGVLRELKEIKRELAAPVATVRLETEYHDTGHSLDKGVEWTARPTTGGVLLIAVNADKNPVELTWRLPGARSVEVLFEKRPVRVSSGAWRDDFAPFGSRIYKVVLP